MRTIDEAEAITLADELAAECANYLSELYEYVLKHAAFQFRRKL